MDALKKLSVAKSVLLSFFSKKILEISLSKEHFTFKLIFTHNERLFIRYNDYNEYSYQYYFFSQLGDFICFDNFDDRWPISTRPHHLHTKNKKVIESVMNGDPNHDIPLLSQKVLKFLY
ncbi:MAG: hypothetical protein ACTSWX_11335 [Promethearchaeota archaeon]